MVKVGIESAGTGSFPVPISFGVGRKDMAVRLIAAHYHISGLNSDIGAGAVVRWGACLSQNPDHENSPPTLTFANTDSAVYALGQRLYSRQIAGAAGGWALIEDGLHVPLYGLLRPFRQVLIMYNSTNLTVKLAAEIFYAPVDLPLEDLNTLNRQKGSYRRT